MKLLLGLIVGLIVAAVVVYWFFPQILLAQVRAGLRRKGRLTQKSIRVGATDWPYLEGGDPAGVPVVLVHGFGGDKDAWAFYAPYLTGKYRLICPDLPGFGENERAGGSDYSMAGQANGLLAFLDALGIDKCHLGGNSMGGFIALRFALDHPERLRSLTLFNNAGVTGTEPSELEGQIGEGQSPLVARDMAGFDRLMAFIVYKPSFLPGQFKKVLLAQTIPHVALLDRIFAALVEEMQSRPLNAELPGLTVPTLIVWGRHDRLIHHSCAVVQHAAIPGSEMTIFEDVGHVPMIEQPERTAQVHLPFLARH